jgi:uncharacterized protein (DUF427 family)
VTLSNDDETFGWHYRGGERPPFAIQPGPGQESVWDYPRPPAIVTCDKRIEVRLGARVIASTRAAFRVLETAGAPTYYLPPDTVDFDALIAVDAQSFCEWKGTARYWDVTDGQRRVARAAWSYPDAGDRFAAIAGCIAFYCDRLDCRVDGQRAFAQPGGFYGGWVTPDIVGPFKGEPGTQGW